MTMTPYNAANWHRKSKKVTPWAKSWFERELVAMSADGPSPEGAQVVVEHVAEVEGDVELWQARLKGASMNGMEVTGHPVVPEVPHEFALDRLSDYTDKRSLALDTFPSISALLALAKRGCHGAQAAHRAAAPRASPLPPSIGDSRLKTTAQRTRRLGLPLSSFYYRLVSLLLRHPHPHGATPSAILRTHLPDGPRGASQERSQNWLPKQPAAAPTKSPVSTTWTALQTHDGAVHPALAVLGRKPARGPPQSGGRREHAEELRKLVNNAVNVYRILPKAADLTEFVERADAWVKQAPAIHSKKKESLKMLADLEVHLAEVERLAFDAIEIHTLREHSALAEDIKQRARALLCSPDQERETEVFVKGCNLLLVDGSSLSVQLNELNKFIS
ncbi:hypothetical protein OF83DRAFT_1183560 [Amylostereum chailletii]|nr:hypothetical protein OF83DRAFT_1183560 [Amylostereum chailletii]